MDREVPFIFRKGETIMEITIAIKMDDCELGNSKNKQKETDRGVKPSVSQYAKVFDDSSAMYEEKPEYNWMFLRAEELYMTGLLKARGHLFLNEVYDRLGFARTEAGQVVGWIYDEVNPSGDNYVDFGLDNECNASFLKGESNSALLDFNVDGVILGKM